MRFATQDDVKGMRMSEEDKNSLQPQTGETGTPGTEGQNNNTTNVSQDAKTGKTGQPETVPYARFKEVNDELKKYKESKADKVSVSDLPDSPVDTVLDLVGKVPEHLKSDMKAIAKYATEHKMPVDDAIALWNVKGGHTVPKSEVDKYTQANTEAANSRTGGTANPAARYDMEIKSLSDKDLQAKVNELSARGEI